MLSDDEIIQRFKDLHVARVTLDEARNEMVRISQTERVDPAVPANLQSLLGAFDHYLELMFKVAEAADGRIRGPLPGGTSAP
jgi:hypothetical protein